MVLRPQDSVPDASRDLKAIPIPLCGPDDLRGFVGLLDSIGFRAETPDEIVMQMERLFSFRRDAVNVDAGKLRVEARIDSHRGFFMSFPSGRVSKTRIGLLDVSTRQQPAMEAVMMHEEHPRLPRMKNQSRAGDMAGLELMPRKRGAGVVKETKRQIATFARQVVGTGIKGFDDSRSFSSGKDRRHFPGVFSSCCFVQTRSGSS